MNRQFTDGEIVAAIKAIAADGAPLSRATVRKRLGGGGSTRISAILKEYSAGAYGLATRSGPSGPATQSGPTGPIAQSGPNGPPQRSGPSGPAGTPANAASPLASALAPADEREAEGGVARLESEIRVLKILLESERNARREEEARYARTIEALQREIEIATRCWTGTTRSAGTPGVKSPRAKARP